MPWIPCPTAPRLPRVLPCTLTCGVLCAVSGIAAACDSCGCHVPSTQGTEGLGLTVGVFAQYTDFGTLREEGHRIDNPDGQYLHSTTTQLIVGERVLPWLSVTAFVPYINRGYRRPNNGVEETGSVSGLGDSTVMASARLLQCTAMDTSIEVTALLGVKAPTGNPSQLKYEYADTQGVDLPGDDSDPDSATGGHDLALGSGAWDVVGGATGTARWGRWYVSGLVTYTYNTEGAYTYRFANEIAATGSVGYVLVDRPQARLWAQLNLDGDSKDLDTVADQRTTDTANHNLFIGPEVQVLWHRQVLGDAAVDVPLEEHNSDTQLVPTWRVRGSVTAFF